MAKRIYKYPIEVKDEQSIEMPMGATILCVQVQREKPNIWAVVEENAVVETRKFVLYGTGHALNGTENLQKYIGTFQMQSGNFVFHLFERIQIK